MSYSLERIVNWHEVMDTIELGKLIRAERKRQKLTQLRLAAHVGVGVRFLRELEEGKPTSQIGLVLAVLQGLTITVAVAAGDGEPIL